MVMLERCVIDEGTECTELYIRFLLLSSRMRWFLPQGMEDTMKRLIFFALF